MRARLRAWLGLGYVAPVYDGPAGPETVDVLRAVKEGRVRSETWGARTSEMIETVRQELLGAVSAAEARTRADLARAIAIEVERGRERLQAALAEAVVHLAGAVRAEGDAGREHTDTRIRLMAPPPLQNATAHSDAEAPAGFPITCDCGHLATSYVTDRRTGATRCADCALGVTTPISQP